MIGQERFKSKVQEFVENNKFPLFSIITGQKGIGKKEACKEIAKRLNCQYVIWGNKIEDIRELKVIMENQDKTIIYCIPDYEDMSLGAKNSILKICEEPPRNAHIVLTSYSKDIILPTILGRGTVFELDAYTKSELEEICKLNNIDSSVIDISVVPGDLITASKMDCREFKSFVDTIWDKIDKASAGNLLKVTQKIKVKEDGNGYDLDLFLNYLYTINSKHPNLKERMGIFEELLEAKKAVQLKYNKQYILDNLLLSIRGIRHGTI